MAHHGNLDAHSGLFGAPLDAPLDSDGTSQARVDADLVILPGGLLLVEQSSPLAHCEGFCDQMSGDIHCDNGRV